MYGGHFLFSHHHLQTPKMSRAFLVCLGNRALATFTAFRTFLLDNAFLACLLISFLITCSALRLTPRATPAFKPLSVLPGAFKGFRLLLSPWRPPRAISHRIPLPSWYSSGRNRDKLPPSMLTKVPLCPLIIMEKGPVPLFLYSPPLFKVLHRRCGICHRIP